MLLPIIIALCHHHSDNGMLVLPGVKYDMTFTAWDKFTVTEFKNNVKTRLPCIIAIVTITIALLLLCAGVSGIHIRRHTKTILN